MLGRSEIPELGTGAPSAHGSGSLSTLLPLQFHRDLMLNVDGGGGGATCQVCQGGGQSLQLESGHQRPEGSEGPATLGLPSWDVTKGE